MAMLPRFDLMRSTIDRLRNDNKKDGLFIKSVYASAYGVGFYREHAINYARTILNAS